MFTWLKGQKSLGKKKMNKNSYLRLGGGGSLLIRTTKERLTPQVRGEAASQFFAKLPGAAVCLDIFLFQSAAFYCCVFSCQKKIEELPRIIPSYPRSTRCRWTPLYWNTKPFTLRGYSLALPVYRVSLRPDASWQEVLLSIPAQRAGCLGFFVPAERPASRLCA